MARTWGGGGGSCVLTLAIVELVTFCINNQQYWSCVPFVNYPNELETAG